MSIFENLFLSNNEKKIKNVAYHFLKNIDEGSLFLLMYWGCKLNNTRVLKYEPIEAEKFLKNINQNDLNLNIFNHLKKILEIHITIAILKCFSTSVSKGIMNNKEYSFISADLIRRLVERYNCRNEEINDFKNNYELGHDYRQFFGINNKHEKKNYKNFGEIISEECFDNKLNEICKNDLTSWLEKFKNFFDYAFNGDDKI